MSAADAASRGPQGASAPCRSLGRRRRRPARAARLADRRARPVGLRQDHAAAPDRRLPRARRRHHPFDDARSSPAPAGRVPPQERRVGYVPQEGALFPHLDVAAQHRLRAPPRRAPAPAPASTSCSTWSSCPRAFAARAPARALRRPAAARRPGPGAGPAARRSCCSTSRSPRSTPRCASRPAGRSPGRCAPRRRPRCWSPTTRPRRSRWPTRSRCMRAGPARAGRLAPRDVYRSPARPRGGPLRRRRRAAARPRRSAGVARPAPSATVRLERGPAAADDLVLVLRPDQVVLDPARRRGDASTRSASTATTRPSGSRGRPAPRWWPGCPARPPRRRRPVPRRRPRGRTRLPRACPRLRASVRPARRGR